ncbi:lytic polysaccharide monooxygenase [Macroventuria anomochaeta]|uniref:Lytic polysaccharide monooxygenase n=1 Tax=Macroventuria anomochaeta TaxID=301207 RepID=A0ACB6SFW3_9PLEO|nr:lytic polysaccharide monooxygenase [Macroventuria anomochaeta]KAF2632154.1 lytic polysaccharide monooxygenase [Macroventuria anomochaeta]
MTKTTLFAAVLAMASTASAHMFIESPVPFSGVMKDPLQADGSNFPCQGSGYQITTMNEWAVGSDVTVSFPSDQTATHGGGSCQISVSKDEKPTASSKWKVIHSILGGCPTTGAGNSGELGKFGFKVPSELPEGQLTMAWTWFNKVGQREMYMNCAPIKVSGGTGKGFDDLPDMAIANINAPGACKTSEGFDYTFANPGESVVKLGTGPFKELCGGAASEGGNTTPSASSGNSGNPDTAPAPASPKEPATTPAPTTPQALQAPSTGGSTCPKDDAILCNGESQFGVCSNGQVIYQPVAAGTKCSNGKIARRDLHRNARTAIPAI